MTPRMRRRTERKRVSQHGPTFSAIPANFVHVRTHAVLIDVDDNSTVNSPRILAHEQRCWAIYVRGVGGGASHRSFSLA